MSRSRAAADVFQAVADPTRRAILDLLLLGEQPVGGIASRFAVSLSAVSQHIRVLREAGLVEVRHAGRERLYRLNAAPLQDVYAWASHYEAFWREKLEALARYLEETE
jgi:DNA-binding transcriptional ArsR family regulator